MANQKHTEIIIALGPLNTLFGQLVDEKAALYCEKLESYDLAVIKRAVSRVQENFEPTFKSPYPAIATLRKACEDIAKAANAGRWTADGQNTWEEKDRARNKLVADYMHQFRSRPIMAEARAGGFDSQMERYAREIASIQAQLIIPQGHGYIGMESHIIEIGGLAPSEYSRWQREFIAEMRRIIGHAGAAIDVHIPNAKIEEWKRERMRQEARKAGGDAAAPRSRYDASLGESLAQVRDKMGTPLPAESAEGFGDIPPDFLP